MELSARSLSASALEKQSMKLIGQPCNTTKFSVNDGQGPMGRRSRQPRSQHDSQQNSSQETSGRVNASECFRAEYTRA